MDRGETSACIFVGYDSKITHIYRSKENSVAEFLGALQDHVHTREVLTKLVADNSAMLRGWNAINTYEILLFLCYNMKQTFRTKTQLRTDIKL